MSQDHSILEALPPSIAPDVINTMPIPMICFNSNHEALYYNEAFASYIELENASVTDLVGIGTLNAMDIMPEFQPNGAHSTEKFQKNIELAQKKGSFQTPWLLQSVLGRSISTHMSIVVTEGVDAYYINCYFLDTAVTARSIKEPKLSENDLEHLNHIAQPAPSKKPRYETAPSQELDQDILENLPLVMHIWSKDLVLIDCSSEVTNVFNVADKEEFKQKFFTLCPEMQLGKKSEELMKSYLQQAFQDGFYKFKWLHADTTGKIFPCEVTLCRITYNNENCLLGYTQDLSRISSHVQEFAKVQESTRAMLDAAPMAIALWGNDYLLRDANFECARLFGFDSPEDFMKNFRTIIPRYQADGSSSFSMVKEALQKAFHEGYYRSNFSLYHRTTHTRIPLEITLVRLTIWNEEVVVAYIRDLRDINSLIEKMQTTEERIQAIFDITPLGINVWDQTFNLIECNDAIVQLYGFTSKGEYMAAHFRSIPRLQPDGTSTIPFMREILQQAFDTGYSRVELLTKDLKDNPIPVEITSKKTYVQQQEVVISYMRDLREREAKLAEIRNAEKDLRTARDLAEQSAEAKTKFLGNMSHEIRTPLNAVLGLLHVLDTTALQPVQKDYVGKSITSATKLMDLVNNILDFSSIDAGTFEMENVPFLMKDIADEIKLVYGPQAEEKALQLQVHVDNTEEETLHGDAARLKQVLFYIVHNALKFTEKGHITVNITCTERVSDEMHYTFSVEDSGLGMTPTQSMHIFSAFAQADSSITRKHQGAGLGLAIAKRLSRLMGGDLWVKSEESKGSTFYFTAIFKGEKKIAQSPDSAQATALTESSKVESAQSTGEKYSILLAEDNDINQLITVVLLQNKGHQVDVASDGKEAVQMVQEKNYDMVLMDIQMPTMDGLTATSNIRALKSAEELPIVAMSAHAMSGDVELSLQFGMNDHLSKPIIPELLYETVEKWCKKKHC